MSGFEIGGFVLIAVSLIPLAWWLAFGPGDPDRGDNDDY